MREYKVLHLEDSNTDSQLVQRVLHKAGINFRYFLADNKEGLDLGLSEFQPDIVLCDHSMPAFNSKMAFALCREKNPDIPFILVTGAVSEEFAVDMIQTGVDDYLLKTNLQRLPLVIKKAFLKKETEHKIKTIQLELNQSETHLRTIFENSTVGFILLDTNCWILELNSRANYFTSLAFGLQLGKGQNLLFNIPDYRKRELSENFEKVLEGQRFRYEAVYPDGEKAIHFNVNFSPVIDIKGEISGCCLSMEDITERNKIELALRKSEGFNKGILTSINYHIAVAEENGNIISVNKAWNDFFLLNGKTPLERVGLGINYIDIYHQSAEAGDILAAKALNGFHQVVKKEIPVFEMEYPVILYNEQRWFMFRIVNFAGDPAKAVMMHIDITERIKAEKEIRDYKHALDESSAVDVSDSNGVIQYANENFCKISKYSSGELIGQDHRILNSGFHSKGLFRDLWDTVSSGEIWRNEVRNKAKDGSFFWVNATIVPFLDIDGKPFQFITIREDITLRKIAETRMMEAVERYDIIADATSDTIWDWDISTNKMLFNVGMTRNFGYGAAEIENVVNWWNTKIHPDDAEKVADTLIDVFANRLQRFQLTYRFRCKDDSYKDIFDRAFVIFNETGKPCRIIGAMQDITFQVQEEILLGKAIIEAQDNERRYIGEELHDNINQILAGSLLILGMIKDSQNNVSKVSEFVEITKGYIGNAIDEVRKLSHQLVPVCLDNTSLKEIFENLLFYINLENRFSINFEFNEFRETIIPGKVQLNLYRILQEQTKNILKYSEASFLKIVVTLAGSFVSLVIFDNGKGFNVKTLKNGIGLGNIKRRAESLGGKFTLNSTPGNGCEIIVEIPLNNDLTASIIDIPSDQNTVKRPLVEI